MLLCTFSPYRYIKPWIYWRKTASALRFETVHLLPNTPGSVSLSAFSHLLIVLNLSKFGMFPDVISHTVHRLSLQWEFFHDFKQSGKMKGLPIFSAYIWLPPYVFMHLNALRKIRLPTLFTCQILCSEFFQYLLLKVFYIAYFSALPFMSFLIYSVNFLSSFFNVYNDYQSN